MASELMLNINLIHNIKLCFNRALFLYKKFKILHCLSDND